jgi:cell fate regulator YaaT (PSP1 superfamily)
MRFDSGDFVITDADRGLDIGRVIGAAGKPQFRELKNVKVILRKASEDEIRAIPAKEEREGAALVLCQAKVQELGLPMQITGAEFQFDGKKLTFYYSASKYVDFRNLVKGLFRIFGTRIWMVWYDGSAPVRDVYSRGVDE